MTLTQLIGQIVGWHLAEWARRSRKTAVARTVIMEARARRRWAVTVPPVPPLRFVMKDPEGSRPERAPIGHVG